MGIIENGRSGVDNLNEIGWVKNLVQKELKSLNNNVATNFYERNGNTVTYKMDLVKDYLDKIKDIKWSEFIKSPNASVWIMAIQIALESLGYDVGRIDGQYWMRVKQAVAKFQVVAKVQKVPDWTPGANTIKALLRSLEASGSASQGAPSNNPEKPVNGPEMMTLADLKKLGFFDVNTIWRFTSKGFVLKKWLEKTDNNWNKYIEINGKRVYKAGPHTNWICYSCENSTYGNWVEIWECEDWLIGFDGHYRIYADDGGWKQFGAQYWWRCTKFYPAWKGYPWWAWEVGQFDRNGDLVTWTVYAKDGKTVLEKRKNWKKVRW